MSEVPKPDGDGGQQIGDRIEEIRGKIGDEIALLRSQGINLNVPMMVDGIRIVTLIKILIKHKIITEEDFSLAFETEMYETIMNAKKQIREQEFQKKLVIPKGMKNV